MRTVSKIVGLLAGAAAVVAVVVFFDRNEDSAGHVDDGHPHPAAMMTAFGEPGDPNAPSRDIAVAMVEFHDGRMVFSPPIINVRRGEQVRFVIKNEGDYSHEMVIATLAENLHHAEEMKRNPDMIHDDPNHIWLSSLERGNIVWRFTKAGEFDFSCLIPGHREAGMFGKIIVR